MVDIVDPATRSRMMSGIRGKNTKPELKMRKALHRLGLRFRLHVRDLPGTPDIVFPRLNAVIFIHGCFWHGHGCQFFKIPQTRKDFWVNKISKNKESDQKNYEKLKTAGWRIGVVWECAIRRGDQDFDKLTQRVAAWLLGNKEYHEEK